MNELSKKAWLKLGVLAVVMGLLLFLGAGTVQYWQAWVYLAIFFGFSIFTTGYLIKKDPGLLERRLRGGPTAEKQKTQKIIMLLAVIGFAALLVVPALDARFQWSNVPTSLVILGDAFTLLGFYITFLVYKENSFAASTIQVSSDQKVISTGLYAIVRHPMYAGGLIYLLGMPLALGSYWAFPVFIALLPVLIWRLLNEEQFLAKNLPGYTEYCKKVGCRLIPKVF